MLSCLLAPSLVGAAQPVVDETVRLSEANHAVAESVDTFGLISHNADYHSPASNLETVSIGNAACCDQSGWFGDLGIYILNPTWSNGNAAFAVTRPINGVSINSQVNFDHDNEFVPFFQIGYAGRNGLGVRGRWWTVDSPDTQDFAGPINATNGVRGPSLLGAGSSFVRITLPGYSSASTIEATNRLRMDVIDLEGIWSLEHRRSSVLLSAGIRYAHVAQAYNATHIQNLTDLPAFPPLPNLVRTDTFESFHSFNCAGPTISAQLNRGIGDTNLSIYGLSRGSMLVGEHRHATFADYTVLADQAAVNVSNGVLPVLEFEVGGSWVRPTRHFDLFLEGGFVAMTWFNAGNGANTDPIVGNGVGSDNANQNMHLTGLRFSSGVRF